MRAIVESVEMLARHNKYVLLTSEGGVVHAYSTTLYARGVVISLTKRSTVQGDAWVMSTLEKEES